MSKIINTAKVLRRNWKKSTFFFGVIAYGTSYFVDKYKTFQMMRAYCEEARKYGEKSVSSITKPLHVTVILNPEANDKKCNVQFEKFAAPLLHLAGFKVSIFQTEREKQAQELMQVMSNTDAVLVAGGNGTLQEVVTGLLRRPEVPDATLPLGVIPLGKTNTVAKYLFGSKSSSRPQLMAEAAMAVIREKTVNLDCLKVQFLGEEQPVYGMCSFEQGIFADVEPLVQKYWYLGFLKDKYTYVKNSLKSWQPIENVSVEYVAPCGGCSKCYSPSKRRDPAEQGSRWWQVFVPKKTETRAVSATENFSKRVNEDCGTPISLPPQYSNLSVLTAAFGAASSDKPPTLQVKTFPKDLSMLKFISSGLSHRLAKHEDQTGIANIVEARQLTIHTSASVDDNIHSQIVTNDLNHSEDSSKGQDPELPHAEAESSLKNIPPNKTESSEKIEPLNSTKVESNNPPLDKNSPDLNDFSYIDSEKYSRSSCIITILPKQVTVYV